MVVPEVPQADIEVPQATTNMPLPGSMVLLNVNVLPLHDHDVHKLIPGCQGLPLRCL